MIASKMVLSIIAPNIKTGGGKELLEYLLKYIDQEYPHLVVNVYLDSSLVNIKEADNRKIFLLSSSLEKVLLFGKKINIHKFQDTFNFESNFISSDVIYKKTNEGIGFFNKILSEKIWKRVPFEIKSKRYINKERNQQTFKPIL